MNRTGKRNSTQQQSYWQTICNILIIFSFSLLFLLLSFGFNIQTSSAKPLEKPLEQAAQPADEWCWLNPSPQGNDLRNIACPAENFCYSVGYSGTILTNQHGNWELLKSGTGENLYGLSCPTTQVCYVGGDNGTLLKTTDSGQTWLTKKSASITTTIQQIDCPTTANCYLAASRYSSGLNFFASEDGGDNWFNRSPGSSLGSFSCPTFNTCYIYAESNSIFKTVDRGLSWSSQPISTPGPLTFSCVNANTCM